jgi:hypothetical protein
LPLLPTLLLSDPVSGARPWRQFRKNLTLQKRQVGVIVIQLVIPCALVGLIGLIQVLVDRAVLNNTVPTPEYYGPLNVSATLPRNDNGTLEYALLTHTQAVRKRAQRRRRSNAWACRPGG